MIIEKSALLQYTKHAVPKIISPEANQDADAYKYGYRNYGLADVYENKVCGIYLHTATKQLYYKGQVIALYLKMR